MRYVFLFSFFFAGNCLAQKAALTGLVHKADSLFETHDWKASAETYQQALKIDDKDGRIWYKLGETYQSQKMYNDAIKAYQKSLELKSAIIPPVFVRTSLAKTYSLKKDSASMFALLTAMLENGYANFPDLNTADEYGWLRSTPRFAAIITKATSNAYPCSNNPQNMEFDFWLGEWRVYQTGTDYQVGKQKIEKVCGGCMIIENWTAIGFPNDGKSMNFISPKTKKWEQVWMGSGGVYLNYYNGEYKDSAMRYEGDGVDKDGNKILFHLTYFNLGPASLRHLLEQSVDNGKTWSTLYDFTYKK